MKAGSVIPSGESGSSMVLTFRTAGRLRISVTSSGLSGRAMAASRATFAIGWRCWYTLAFMTVSSDDKRASSSGRGGLSYSPFAHSECCAWTASSTWNLNRMIPAAPDTGRPLASFGRKIGRL